MRLAIIGNAPYSNIKIGDYIDSFDDIVRFNYYTLKGHEEFIGSKTTIWAFHDRIFQNITTRHKQQYELFLKERKVLIRTHGDIKGKLKEVYNANSPKGRFDIINWKMVKNLQDILGSNPSTGMCVLHRLLYDYDEIFYYGLGKLNQCSYHHYFSTTKSKGKEHLSHNGFNELEYINKLEQENDHIHTINIKLKKYLY